MQKSLKVLTIFISLMMCPFIFGSSINGYSGMFKLIDPVTHGSGYFSVNLSTLLGPAAESPSDIPDSLKLVSSSSINDYFQSTNHISLNVSLGN